ncbi:hypothetical protein J6590_035899 [Homalodisca vitripennis]|nr:hypothetical protein J6590_025722 [Homalodisca vitripennis]KAG8311816.1 hypothetical protein J6590_035899 [Homalodisca vitripennis]
MDVTKKELTLEEIDIKMEDLHEEVILTQNVYGSQRSQRGGPPASQEMDFGSLQSQEVHTLLSDIILTSKYDHLLRRASQEPKDNTSLKAHPEVAFTPSEHPSWYGRESSHDWECPKCLFRFTRKCVLNKHQLNCRHDFPCPVCAKRFAEEAELKEHADVHMSNPHRCSRCDAMFPTEILLNDHARKHRKRRSAKPESAKVEPKPRKNNKKGSKLRARKPVDRISSQDFVIRKNAKGVEKAITKSSGREGNTLKCTVCDASFAEEKVLVEHLMKYTKQTAKCFHCNSTFKHVDLLRVHIIELEHMRPFSCLLCYYWFPKLRDFYKHNCPGCIV